MDDIKYCSNCGNKLNSDSVFCDKCGQKVMKDTNEIIKCPYCQSSLQKNVIKCPNCGEWIDKSQKPIKKNINNLFKKIHKLTSNKKLFYIPKIVFVYAFINTIFYQINNFINHKFFVFDTIESSSPNFTNPYLYIYAHSSPTTYNYYLSHKMDSFTQFIHQIGTILYGDFNSLMDNYTLSGGITDKIDIIWFILFLISLIVSIQVINNRKNLKSYFYLILTIVSYTLMLVCSRTIRFNILPHMLIIILIIIIAIISRHSTTK